MADHNGGYFAHLRISRYLQAEGRGLRRLGRGLADEMAILVDRPRQYGEVHLPVVIDCYYPDDRLGVRVTGNEHGPGVDPGWIAGLA